MKNKTAVLLGASGLIGSHCLDSLLKDDTYSMVKIFLRRDISIVHPKLKKHIIDFDQIIDHENELSCDDVFCCLGTTIKQAGSQKAFARIDHDIPLEFARLAKEKGAKQYLFISSIGADPGSGNFYLRTKGQVEEGLKKIGFERLVILRPSMLLGSRKQFRIGESIGKIFMFLFSPLMFGTARKYRPVQAKKVAFFMVKTAAQTTSGTYIIESNNIG